MMNTDDHTLSPWQHVDAVLVINLEKRKERWTHLKESIDGMIPEDKVTRFPAVLGIEIPGYGERPWFRGRSSDTRWAARAGCTLSHRATQEMAAARNWDLTLVLEDDADFSGIEAEELNEALRKLLEVKNTWDVCYLGFSKTRGPSRLLSQIGNHGIYQVTGCSAAHAYLVNAKAREWILKGLPSKDRIWSWTSLHRISDRWYSWNMSRELSIIAVSPSMINQQVGFSDLVQNVTDYNLEFPGKIGRESNNAFEFYAGRLLWHFQRIVTLLHDALRCLKIRVKGF